MKQLPLDRHFDINNVKRVSFVLLHYWYIFSFFPLPFVLLCFLCLLHPLIWLFNYQIVLEADGYQPYLISPEKGLRSLIKGVLELAKEPSRLCVDEVFMFYALSSFESFFSLFTSKFMIVMFVVHHPFLLLII